MIKNKSQKIIAFILLLSIIGLTFPQPAHAVSAEGVFWGCSAVMGVGVVLGLLTFGAGAPIAIVGAQCAAGAYAVHSLTAEGSNILKALTIGLMDILRNGVQSLATYAVGLISSYLTSDFLTEPILTQAAFITAWVTVRDIANIFIVLGLIAIAVTIILKLRDYDAKKLLVPLIIVALLVNFSNVICGLIIDVSNILIISFINSGSDVGPSILRILNNASAAVPWGALSDNGNLSAYTGQTFINIIGYIMVMIVFFYLAFMLIVGRVVFAILFILSPLAFVLRVFPLPQTKKIWTMWWETFLQWAFIGIQISFFLWVASRMNTNTVISTIPILVLLYIAIKIARKSSPIGAQAVMGLGAAGLGFAAGATLGAVKGLGKLTGYDTPVKNAYNAVRDTLTDSRPVSWIRDRLGGTGASATARQAKMQERLKEPTERLKNVDSRTLGQTAANGRTATDRAAATNILKERNDLDEIPVAARQVAMQNAMTHDNRLKQSDFAKSDYRFGEFNQRTLDRIQATNPTFTNDQVRRAARQEQLETNLPTMSGEQRRNIDTGDITPDLIVSRVMNANYIRNNRTADRAHINAYRDPAIRARLRTEIAAARAANNRAEVNRLRNIRKEIRDLP